METFKMKSLLLFFILYFAIHNLKAQEFVADYTWWNVQHGWEEGDPGWRNWMKISPGYLGPNALPVPPVKKGLISDQKEIELTGTSHFHRNDPTQDISGRLYIPFANNRIAVEIYGVIQERFAFSEKIRNERIARIEDGNGYAVGDFYFSTLIQILKDKKFPNTLFRFATKTASGNKLEGARHTDSPGYFFDLSFSKEVGNNEAGVFRPFGLFGFYSWQTNDELNLQNDAHMYALGFDIEKNKWLLSGSWAGYSGYKNERDRPMQLNFDIRKNFNITTLRAQYIHGLRDWEYKTVKLSVIWNLNFQNEL